MRGQTFWELLSCRMSLPCSSWKSPTSCLNWISLRGFSTSARVASAYRSIYIMLLYPTCKTLKYSGARNSNICGQLETALVPHVHQSQDFGVSKAGLALLVSQVSPTAVATNNKQQKNWPCGYRSMYIMLLYPT